MVTLAEIVSRAEQLAVQRGIDPHKSQLTDAGMTLEALYPHAINYVIHKDLETGGSPQNYVRTLSVPYVNGVGQLPETALREYLCTSYLPDKAYSSYIPYPDYKRNVKFDNLITYYSSQGGSFYSGLAPVPSQVPVRDFGIVSIGNQTDTAFGNSTELNDGDVGKRATLVDNNQVIFDSFIDDIADGTFFNIRGHSLTQGTNGDLYVHRSDQYTYDRAVTGLTTTLNSALVLAAAGTFTYADLGKRLTVLDSNGDYIVDAIIMAVGASGTSGVTLTAKAMAASTTATGTVYTSDHILGVLACTASITDSVITVQPSVMGMTIQEDHVGHRFYLYDPGNGLVADGIIDYRLSPTSFVLRGRALATAAVATPGFIYRADQYGKVLGVTDVTAVITDNLFTSTTPELDAAANYDHSEWRARITTGDDLMVIADSFIQELGGFGTGEITVGLGAISSATNCHLTIYAPGVQLNIPATPDAPASATEEIDMSPSLAEDVIVAMAAAVTGELSLPQLLVY